MNNIEDPESIHKILKVIQDAVRGSYHNHLPLTGERAELDDLALGVNLLLEEFRTHSMYRFRKKKKLFYISILEQLPVGIAVLDKHLKYVYCNTAYFPEEQLRLEALGQSDYDLFQSGKISRTQAYIRLTLFRQVREKKAPVSVEEVVEKDNVKRHFVRVVSPLMNQSNVDKELFICCLTDITSSRTLQEELSSKNQKLEKTNHELDKFIHHVTHDLKAPLASLQGLIDISSKVQSPEQLAENFEMMKKNVKKMNAFIQTILEHSKNATTNNSFALVDFKNEVDNILQLLQHMEDANRVNFNIDIKCNVDFYSDPIRVHMILSNLISNAIKYHNYHQDEPFVHIIIKGDERQAKIIVIDNGEGIAQEHHAEVFQSFKRISEKSKGSGLGLYLVKEVVEKLGGKISFESALGKGSCFEVIIPNAAVSYGKKV